MKQWIPVVSACCLVGWLAGCGQSDYSDIPEIDAEQAAQHEADYEKEMQAEMERQASGGGN